MIVFHVYSYKKLDKYKKIGYIIPPVRVWENMEQVVRMSKSTGWQVILRLRFPDNADKLDGYYGQARVLNYRYDVGSI